MPSNRPRQTPVAATIPFPRLSEREAFARQVSLSTSDRIAVARCGDPASDEVAEMVVDTLRSAEFQVEPVVDGQLSALEAKVLLLVGSGRQFPQFAHLARRSGKLRPRIVLWHQQPLPPPVLTQRAGELGGRLIDARWEHLLGPWAKSLSRVLPPRGRVREVLQRLLAVPVRHEFERLGGTEFGNVGWDDLCAIFEEAAWFHETFNSASPWIDVVACNTPTRVAFLRQCGIGAKFVPLGFHPAWGEMPTAEREVDVLFVGSLHTPNRRSLVPEVLRRLRDWGYTTKEVETIPSGAERTRLLQSARVVLNVLRFPWEFPGPRLFASAACGALCVSNEAVQNEPFQPELHFIRAPRTRMAESICRYLSNEEERRRKAGKALQSFSTDFPLLVSVQKLLDSVLSAQPLPQRRAA